MRDDAAGHHWQPRAARLPVVMVVLLVTVVLLGAGPAAAQPDAEPAGRQVFDRARPGVHLILVEFTAQVTIPHVEFDVDRLRAHTLPIATRQQVTTQQQFLDLMIDAIHGEPLRFLRPLPTGETIPVTLTSAGSGFVVSPAGHIVTNAHVVAPNAEELQADIATRGLAEVNTAIAGELTRDLAAPGLALDAAQVQQVVEALEQFTARHLRMSQVTTSISLGPPGPPAGVDGAGAGDSGPPARLAAQLTIAGEPIPGKDVAVIKVDGVNDLPTVRLGDDTTLGTGDRLFVLGYPAAATFNPLLSEESQTEPTLTSGLLSAKKTMDAGFTILQTDATMTQGNSGGPVLDADGNAIGIATFGTVDPDTGQAVDGANFVMPVSVVREFLDRAGVQPAESVTTRTYNAALDAYEQHWYARALPLFVEVQELYPAHPQVGQFISDSQTAIAQGRDETPREGLLGIVRTMRSPILVVAVVVLLLVVVTVLVVVGSRTRRRSAQLRAGAAPPSAYPAQAYPASSPAPYSPTPGATVPGATVPGATVPGATVPAPTAWTGTDHRPAARSPAATEAVPGGAAQRWAEPWAAPTRAGNDLQANVAERAGGPAAGGGQPEAAPAAAAGQPTAPTSQCPFCSGPLRATARFCPTCGNKVR